MRPKTPPNGSVPPLLRMYEPEGPLDSSNTSDNTQYEKISPGGVSPEFLSVSSLIDFRMKPAFQWLSMLTRSSPVPPPWPE